MDRVYGSMAGISDATNPSSSMLPTTSGRTFTDRDELFRIVGAENGESVETLQFLQRLARTASSRFPLKFFSIRCAITSVSVSVVNLWPSAMRLRFSAT